MLRGLLAAGLVALVAPRPAEACSCSVETITFPEDGAVQVPIDAHLYVWGGPHSALRLTSDTGEVTGVTVEELWTFGNWHAYELVPPQLEAATRHQLRDGETIIASFATGQEPALASSIAIAELTPREASYQGDSTCGPGIEDLGLVLAGDAEVLSLTVGTYQGLIVPRKLERIFGSPSGEFCKLPFALETRDNACVTVAPVSAAGQLGTPVMQCVPIEHCAPVAADTQTLTCLAPADGGGGGCSASGTGGAGAGLVALLLLRLRRRRAQA